MKMNPNCFTNFVKETLHKEPKDVKAFLIKENGQIKEYGNDEKFDLPKMQASVGGYIELVGYIEDDNYELVVDEEGLCKNKDLNLKGMFITGHQFVGAMLVLRKGVLK